MVARNNTRRNILIGVFVILLVGGLYFAFGVQEAIGGFTALSIDDINVENQGELIKVFGVSQGAEELIIDFSAEEITEEIKDEGFEATRGVTGGISLRNQVKSFPISKNNNQQFYKLDVRSAGFFFGGCPSERSGEELLGSIRSQIGEKLCIYRLNQGTNSVFTGEDISRSTLSVSIGDESGNLNIGPNSPNTLTLSRGSTVEWTGDLNNYRQVSAPSAFSVLFVDNEFDRLIDGTAYSSFNSELNDFERNSGIEIRQSSVDLNKRPSKGQLEDEISSFNSRVGDDGILIDKTSQYKSAIPSDDVSFSSNSLDVDLNVPSQFPTIILTFNADKVGIRELIGNPEIISGPNDVSIESGESVDVNVAVENVGSSGGSFSSSVECSDDFVSGIGQEVFVENGESANIPVRISGTNTEGQIIDTTCTYRVEDRKSDNFDTANFGVNVEFIEESQKAEPDTDGEGQGNQTGIQPSDCIPVLETYVQEETTRGTGPFGIGRFAGSTETVSTSQCQLSGIAWTLFIIIGSGIIVTLIFIFRRFGR